MHCEIFTGARVVDNTEASRAWARGIVREVLASLPPDTKIIVGDAAGVHRRSGHGLGLAEEPAEGVGFVGAIAECVVGPPTAPARHAVDDQAAGAGGAAPHGAIFADGSLVPQRLRALGQRGEVLRVEVIHGSPPPAPAPARSAPAATPPPAPRW